MSSNSAVGDAVALLRMTHAESSGVVTACAISDQPASTSVADEQAVGGDVGHVTNDAAGLYVCAMGDSVRAGASCSTVLIPSEGSFGVPLKLARDE